jgi:hypothetical protein
MSADAALQSVHPGHGAHGGHDAALDRRLLMDLRVLAFRACVRKKNAVANWNGNTRVSSVSSPLVSLPDDDDDSRPTRSTWWRRKGRCA